MQPEALILSPGPGRPEDAGICIPAIRYFAGKLPILGVCLGHQAICEAFGGTVSYAKQLMHGKQKEIRQCAENRLFRDLPETFPAARYHSLAAVRDTLPEELLVTAKSEDGEVMAVEHQKFQATLIPALQSAWSIRKTERSVSAPEQESWQTVCRKKNLKSAATRQRPYA